MNKASKLYLDVIFQAVVVLPMLVCYFSVLMGDKTTFVAAALLQLAVGAVQLLSGLVYVITRQSKWHGNYFLGACLYLLFLLVFCTTVSNRPLLIFFGIFIPVGIACWYILKSWHYHHNYIGPTNEVPSGDNDLLDDLFQLEA